MRKDRFSIYHVSLGQLVLVDQDDAHIYQYNDYIYQKTKQKLQKNHLLDKKNTF